MTEADTAFLPAHTPDGRIGSYRLVRKLGEGETSSVFLATRDGDYRHEVAIKLIRPGMDSRQILQRFHQERQILAGLNHPNIAQLLDGGSAAGQPYFVMEYVDGEPLDAHCEHRGLPVARRLELFGRVCQAVHFAHRNLVVHRDLKPGNILVAGDGTPKLVDFGIAKLLDPARAGIGVEPTATVARLMTPHYASPEQVQGKPVTTATDVYSLGVILYELLTGKRPYELGSQSLHDIERVVCEAVPPPPSHVARARRERLPRDLDNIVLMAMRKEPERRYGSAQELADDVRRCLERRPVLARRDTLGYRASSFVRRNAGAAAAVAVIFLCLLGGAVATTWQWRRAVAERARAENLRMIAEHTRGFVVELFKVSDSRVAAHQVTAREVLDRGAAQLRGDSRMPAVVRAALVHTLGVINRNVGDYPRAAALLEEAVATRSILPGSELALADSLYQLALFDPTNDASYSSESLLRRALTIRTGLLGPDDLRVADVLEELAGRIAHNAREAEADYRRALDIRRRKFGDRDPRLVSTLAGLAGQYAQNGRYGDAEALVREAIEIRRGADSDDCHGADTLLNELGLLCLRQGLYRDAERYTDEFIACRQRALGPDHPAVVDFETMRIAIWREQGRYAEAEALARRGLTLRRALHGDNTAAVDNALHHLAYVLYERGKLSEAEPLGTTALEMRTRAYGRMHDSVAASLMLLGGIELARGDASTAEASYREAAAIWKRALGDQHPYVANAERAVAEAVLAQGRRDEARALAADALALQRRLLRPGHPAIASTLLVLGAIAQVGLPTAAEPMLRDAVAIRRDALGPDHAYTARAESALGAYLALERRTGEAAVLLRHAVATLRAQLGDDHDETRRARQRLARLEPAPASAP